MAKSQLVAADVANIVFGHIGSNIIAIMVMISALGAANSSVLSTARITQAMGSEGLFFKWAGQINSKNGTPGNALILHALWSILCALSGSFDMLADMFVFASWIFYALSAAGLFILRFKKPHENRPYKVWGYPILTGLFVLFATAYIVMTLYSDINNYLNGKTQLINSVMGLFLIAFGIPFYWYFNKMNIKK
jgi:APA family basic amino acid/polyamine antiporter